MDNLLVKEYFENFEKRLKTLGVREDDILYIASDMTALNFLAIKKFSVKTKEDQNALMGELVNMLQRVVPDGTLLFPVFSWAFCRGETYDIRMTQGEVGVLGNYVLNHRSDFMRTQHPMYSFMVWGKDATYLKGLSNQDAWGEASPFAYLHRNGAKQLSIGTDRGYTFYHYVEQSASVAYRYPKFFISNYIDELGVCETRCYSMYVRNLSVDYYVTLNDDFLINSGAAQSFERQGVLACLAELTKSYDVIKNDLTNNKGRNVCRLGNNDLEMRFNDKNSMAEVKYFNQIGGFNEERSLV